MIGLGLKILIMFAIAWIGIKTLKVFIWVVGIILLASFLSSAIGLFATMIVFIVLLLTNKEISKGLLIFVCLAFLMSLI